MKHKALQIAILCSGIFGCGTNGQETLREFNILKNEVKKNYSANQAVFNELRSCFALRYIKYIEFKEDRAVAIQYRMSDTAKWEKIETTLDANEVKTLLNKEGVVNDYLDNLKKKLDTLNTNTIWLLELYDANRGVDTKALETKYAKTVNGLHFYYKVFEEPLASLPSSFYSLQTQDSIGGLLDKDVIFYYR